ncbi:MAG: hypothetical protein LBT67_02285 [Holosporaceae bacterium]|jgi:CheY-like chemotaxis protein|nr:hypothetical protein [Holosporaceae bacterium]
MNNVLGCFFPTTVVLVDDNRLFAESIKSAIGIDNLVFKVFDDPLKAVDYINEVSSTNRLDSADFIIDGEESTSDWKSILLNINYLHRQIYDDSRFSIISTIVADYCMPGITGIELCDKINDKNIQRILLTGIADEKIAINAFNEGVICKFVKKGDPGFEEKVRDSILKSVHNYFHIYTNGVSKYLSMSERSHLNDPVFANFFFRKCCRSEMQEYYMLDTFGSYLLMDNRGVTSAFTVLTEREMDRLIDVGTESGEISDDVLGKLQSRKYMLSSHSRTGLLPPISEWHKYLREAERLDGYQTYYVDMTGGEILDLDFGEIKSFDGFRKKHQL